MQVKNKKHQILHVQVQTDISRFVLKHFVQPF